MNGFVNFRPVFSTEHFHIRVVFFLNIKRRRFKCGQNEEDVWRTAQKSLGLIFSSYSLFISTFRYYTYENHAQVILIKEFAL